MRVISAGLMLATVSVAASQEIREEPIFKIGANSGLSEPVEGFLASEGDVVLASSLIGETLYTSATDAGEPVGQIRDVIMARGGSVEAVVVGVGGFLGMGEKDVAVSFDRIVRAVDDNDDVWLVIRASADELDRAPAFDRAGQQPLSVSSDYQTSTTAYRLSSLAREAVRAAIPKLIVVDAGQLRNNIETLIGLPVFDANEVRVGRVVGMAGDGSGSSGEIVIEEGSVLGVGGRLVSLNTESFQVITYGDEWDGISTRLPSAELEERPAYTDSVFRGGDEAAAPEASAQ